MEQQVLLSPFGKLSQCLEILLSWPWEGRGREWVGEEILYPYILHILRKGLPEHLETRLIKTIYQIIYIWMPFCIFSCIMLIKGFRYLCWGRMGWLGLISSIRFVFRAQPTCYNLLRGIIRDKKRTDITPPQITQFSCMHIQWISNSTFCIEVENLKNYRYYHKT